MVARCDGQKIVWPVPTHGAGASPFRTAAECIDWNVPCPSIFERDQPLADKTLARIARGIRKFVLENARPFIVPVAYGDKGGSDIRINSADEPLRTICGARGGHAIVSPMMIKAKTYGGGGNDAMAANQPLRTITASKRGEFAIAVPYLVHRSNGERPGQAPRIYDVAKPISTLVGTAKHHGGHESAAGGQALDRPIDTIAARDQKSLTVAHLLKLRGTSESHIDSSASSMESPIPTIAASGTHMAAVSAFLVRYNGTGEAENPAKPLGTLTTKDRYGLVTIRIEGEEYILADIGMRMLTPRELYAAQGFAPAYIIDPIWNGKKLSKTAQIRMVGNSVPPVMAESIARAQLAPQAPQQALQLRAA